MSQIADRLAALGLTLPATHAAVGIVLPFEFAHRRGEVIFLSGHAPLNPDGSLAAPFGKVGAELSVAEGHAAARLTTLAMLASLNRVLGNLDRVKGWRRIFGMVNSAPGFTQQPAVMNGCSELILELYGPERGAHARSAVGMAELPFNIPVEIEAEVDIEP